MIIQKEQSFNSHETFHLLVCGGRKFFQQAYLYETMDMVHQKRHVDLIITGGASGADKLASQWAESRGIAQVIFPANWKGEGNSAGYRRNMRMITMMRVDGVVAFPGEKGTALMVKLATEKGIPVYDLRE